MSNPYKIRGSKGRAQRLVEDERAQRMDDIARRAAIKTLIWGCDYCGETFPTKKEAKEHEARKHGG